MTVSPYAALTSLLLDEGWKQLDSGPQGVLLGKGQARTPVPFELGTRSIVWKTLLAAVADVENRSIDELEHRLTALLGLMPSAPQLSDDRSQVDLHLEGPGVRAHETDAHDYGRFVAAFAGTIKELVKDAFGLARHESALQIVGGASEGSVAVLFREPSMDFATGQAPLPGHERREAPERRAMLSLVQIMNASEQAAGSPNDTALDAHLDLPPRVRRSVASLARIMFNAGWITRGHLTSPALEAIPIVLTLPGSLRLQRSASDAKQVVQTRKVTGVLDGWLWSTATMQLITDEEETIRAAVPAILQSRVAQLNSGEERAVSATFQVAERQAPNGGAVSRSFALTDIVGTNPQKLI